MRISVLICLYNSRPWIVDTLHSVFAQTCQDFEIIAVDDGSTDGCAELIQSQCPDPRLKIFRKDNEGIGPTRNYCMARAAGEWFAFLDHDDLWLPEKLRLQLEAIDRCASPPALTFGDYLVVDAQGSPRSDVGELARRRVALHPDLFRTFLSKGNVIALSTAMMHRSVYDSGIRFRDFKVAEEYDVWLKAAYRTPAYAFVPAVVAKYRVHSQNATNRNWEKKFLEDIELLEEWRPQLQGTRYRAAWRWALAYSMIRYGHGLIELGRAADALRMMMKAFRYAPAHPQAWWGVAKSAAARFMPERMQRLRIGQ